jgi:hypothetical protein
VKHGSKMHCCQVLDGATVCAQPSTRKQQLPNFSASSVKLTRVQMGNGSMAAFLTKLKFDGFLSNKIGKTNVVKV